MLMEVSNLTKKRNASFEKQPKLVQVTMVHSAGIPKTDEETRRLAEHIKQQ